jgi:NADH-quinone oxidoreductase subunit C
MLMPDADAAGHPLRTDFPLRGRFSRAEQTRRALAYEPEDYYIPEELEIGEGKEMQVVPWREIGGNPVAKSKEGEGKPTEGETSAPREEG